MSSNLAESQNINEQDIASKPLQKSNYNPEIKLAILERIFGYSRQTFINWEQEQGNANTPSLKAKIKKHPKHSRLNKRLYDLNDVSYLWDFFRKQGKLPSSPSMPTTIAVWNNKGGVGKSFFSKELASIYSILMGYKVLVIDCDAQSDSTLLLNCVQNFDSLLDSNEDNLQPTVRDAIGWYTAEDERFMQAPLYDTIINLSPNLSVIPADEDLAFMNIELRELPNNNSHLSHMSDLLNKIEAMRKYDIIIFDCPPQIEELIHNILYASDRLLIPIEIEAKCLHSIDRVIKHLDFIGGKLDEYRFDKILALPNKFQSVQTLHNQAIDRLNQLYGETVLSKEKFPLSAEVGKSDEDQAPMFMRAFSNDRRGNNPRLKKLVNTMWNVAHELIDQKPHKDFFENLNEEEIS